MTVLVSPKGGFGYRRVARSSSSLAVATARPKGVAEMGNAGWDQKARSAPAQALNGAAIARPRRYELYIGRR